MRSSFPWQGHPAYLFTTTQGGRFETATPFIFKIV